MPFPETRLCSSITTRACLWHPLARVVWPRLTSCQAHASQSRGDKVGKCLLHRAWQPSRIDIFFLLVISTVMIRKSCIRQVAWVTNSYFDPSDAWRLINELTLSGFVTAVFPSHLIQFPFSGMPGTGWLSACFHLTAQFSPLSLFSELSSFVSPSPAVDLNFHDVIVLAHSGHVAESSWMSRMRHLVIRLCRVILIKKTTTFNSRIVLPPWEFRIIVN